MKSIFFIGWDIGGANTKVCIFDKHAKIKDILHFCSETLFKTVTNTFYSEDDVDHYFIPIPIHLDDSIQEVKYKIWRSLL